MDNVEILRNVLQGRGTQAQEDAVVLNAALALKVGGKVQGGLETENAQVSVLLRDIIRSVVSCD